MHVIASDSSTAYQHGYGSKNDNPRAISYSHSSQYVLHGTRFCTCT